MTKNDLAKIARDSFRGRIRLPQGIIPFRWNASDAGNAEVFDVNGVFPFALACAGTDPGMAADAVKSALAVRRPDGCIPARIAPDGGAAGSAPAWPMLAKAALEVWLINRDAEFAGYVLPRLSAYLKSCMEHYDPTRRGIPCWQNRDESWRPERFEPGLATLDLHIFLISEMEALLRMREAYDCPEVDVVRLGSEKEALEDNMESFFLDEETQTYADRFGGGSHVRQVASLSFLPLLWNGLDAEYRFQLLDGLRAKTAGRQDGGGESDGSSAELLLLLYALMRSRARFTREACKRTFGGKLRLELADPLSARSRFDADIHLCAAAMLVEAEPARPSTGIAGAIARIERRGPAPAAMAAALFLVLGLSGAIWQRLSFTPAESDALTGLARLRSAYGDQEGAERIYRRALKHDADSAAALFGLAEVFLRKGDFDAAEKQYRALLQRDRNSPLALYKLSETLHRRGKIKEAGLCFEDFIRRYGALLPDMARKARSILEGQATAAQQAR